MRGDKTRMQSMKKYAVTFGLALSLGLAAPIAAQEKPLSETEEGFSLLEEGMKLFFKGLLSDMEPTLDEMARAMQDLEPMARDLAAMIGDVRNYEPPEQLPNGDIIIRRKPDAPPAPGLPEKTTPQGQIEL